MYLTRERRMSGWLFHSSLLSSPLEVQYHKKTLMLYNIIALPGGILLLVDFCVSAGAGVAAGCSGSG